MGLSKKKVALSLLVIFILIIVVIIPAYIAYASLHPPRCDYNNKPSDFGLEYTEVETNVGDITLKGWIIEPFAPEKEPIIIIMHGYTSCKASTGLLQIAKDLSARGYRIVMFDFRAHGESGGDTTTIGLVESREDAPAIIDFVATNYPDRPIVLLGYSMGAVVAIMSGINNDRVVAVIADSPYPNLNTVVPRWLKAKMGIPEAYSKLVGFWGRVFVGESTDFGPIKLDSINKPLLVIAGTEDPLVTPDEAREIAQKSPNGRAIIVEGAGHVEAYKYLGEDYINQIDEFIGNVTGSVQALLIPLPSNTVVVGVLAWT